LWSQCDRSNPKGELGGSFGYTQILGGYDGGQAEYVRIPFADTVAALRVPDNIKADEQVLFLSDILPTGFFGAILRIYSQAMMLLYLVQDLLVTLQL
jgi:S-(hydroxymethyl)glutathione dehydrogenase/alcohol dehydrogenase